MIDASTVTAISYVINFKAPPHPRCLFSAMYNCHIYDGNVLESAHTLKYIGAIFNLCLHSIFSAVLHLSSSVLVLDGLGFQWHSMVTDGLGWFQMVNDGL